MKQLTLSPGARNAIRFVARFLNPLVLLIAGRSWMRIVGVICHRGRKTGRVYATPLGMRRFGDSFVMPLTFGDSAAWYRNVAASGSCEVIYMGRAYTLTDPEVIDYEIAAPAFPRYELWQFRFVGIARYLRMRIVRENKAMTRPRNLTLALLVIAFAQLMVVLDTTIVNVALPSVQRALHFSATDLEWVVNGYALAFGDRKSTRL